MYCMAFGVSLSNQNKSAQCYEDRASLLCFTACESDLSHLASIEKIFHHKQVQFLLRVVLGILVADPENTQDLGKCSRPLWYKQMVVIYLNSPSQSSIETVVWKRNDAYLLLHGSGDVGKVVRCKVQEGLDLQSGHLLQDEPVIWWETVSKHFRDDQHIIHIITWGEKKKSFLSKQIRFVGDLMSSCPHKFEGHYINIPVLFFARPDLLCLRLADPDLLTLTLTNLTPHA